MKQIKQMKQMKQMKKMNQEMKEILLRKKRIKDMKMMIH